MFFVSFTKILDHIARVFCWSGVSFPKKLSTIIKARKSRRNMMMKKIARFELMYPTRSAQFVNAFPYADYFFCIEPVCA